MTEGQPPRSPAPGMIPFPSPCEPHSHHWLSLLPNAACICGEFRRAAASGGERVSVDKALEIARGMCSAHLDSGDGSYNIVFTQATFPEFIAALRASVE